MFELAVVLAAAGAGAVASVSGFGIGSILTPLLSLRLGTKLAVAAVSVPHLVGTGLRFWAVRGRVDRRVLLRFGIASAAGGLVGALLSARSGSPALTLAFGAVLVLSGALGVTGVSERLRFSGAAAWGAGALSGLLGGLVGNQGGIRSAAMLGFDVPKEAFVATATAVALLVDGARMPVYLATEGRAVLAAWPLVAVATAGVVAGTWIGTRFLRLIPERAFRRVVSALILVLGLSMAWRGWADHAAGWGARSNTIVGSSL